MSLFQGIFSNLLENKYVSSPAMLFDFKKKQTVNELLKKIIESRGEASALLYSEQLMKRLESFDDKTLLEFFMVLAQEFEFIKMI